MEETVCKTKTEGKRGPRNGRVIIKCKSPTADIYPGGWNDKPDTGGGTV